MDVPQPPLRPPVTLSATTPRRGVVLLVDDQPIIGEAIRRMLSGEDALDFHYCRDPGSALTVAADTAPTVVLLDLVMPEINGLEVLRQLRADERFRELPIIVLSTKEEAAVKAEAFALGANDYLVKLPDRVELVARIRHHSRGYIALLERNLAFEELRISRAVLAEDLASAARYVRSLLPPPGDLAGIRADWRFIPSADASTTTMSRSTSSTSAATGSARPSSACRPSTPSVASRCRTPTSAIRGPSSRRSTGRSPWNGTTTCSSRCGTAFTTANAARSGGLAAGTPPPCFSNQGWPQT